MQGQHLLSTLHYSLNPPALVFMLLWSQLSMLTCYKIEATSFICLVTINTWVFLHTWYLVFFLVNFFKSYSLFLSFSWCFMFFSSSFSEDLSAKLHPSKEAPFSRSVSCYFPTGLWRRSLISEKWAVTVAVVLFGQLSHLVELSSLFPIVTAMCGLLCLSSIVCIHCLSLKTSCFLSSGK